MLSQSVQFEICSSCGREVDEEVCWCGDYMKDHGGYEGHSPVPMGCVCGYASKEA